MIDFSAGCISQTIAVIAAISCTLLFISFNSLLHYLTTFIHWTQTQFHSYQTFNIPRYDGLQRNPLHLKAAVYIASLSGIEDSDTVNLFSSDTRPNDISIQLPVGETVHDSFLQSKLAWISLPGGDLALRICRKDRHRVLRPYLQHVEEVEEFEIRRKEIKMYTNTAERRWRATAFTHPATMDTVAMDPAVKSRVVADLQGFLKGRDYYARLGRVWKRSYLLYGEPGTGKSTFAAAIARFLGYDVYDIDLSLVSDAGELRSLLFDITRKSVVLVENLDRYLEKKWIVNAMNRCCCEERVTVFTAVKGYGAGIDFGIYFPLCDFTTFKMLARSYLGVEYHKLYPRVEEGFEGGGGRLSMAEVGEIMIVHRGSPSRAIKSVINAMVSGAPEKMKGGGGLGLGLGLGEGGFKKKGGAREWKNLFGFIRVRSGNEKGLDREKKSCVKELQKSDIRDK